ncbi:MAG: Gfo/Idh/MocA family oxidoreductase [Cyclobacteriaceae bacterium]|nr:Gfo/Idh/MocA family oxidoreductase [Cyclobacteriaceae bacterium]
MEKTTRREFVKNSTKMAIGAGLISMMPLASSCKGANEKIVIGVIGLRNMGISNLRSFLQNPGVECGAICDIDDAIINERLADIEKINEDRISKGEKITIKKPEIYKDFRRLLENKDIDAVIIGTPDHWHCLMMVLASEAGKHVYVEKPMANSIEESEIMERAARRYGNVVTVGQWQRSSQHWNDAANYVQSGALGKISRVKAWAYTSKTALPIVPDSPVPVGVDYDMWLGPAPKQPFNENRFHYNFRYYWDYAGGLMADWGVHMLDFALLGMQAERPKTISALGGHFSYEDARQTPDTLNVLYDFGDYSINWEHSVCLGNGSYGMGHGVLFQGNNGAVLVSRGGWQVLPEKEMVEGERVDKIEEKAWMKGDNSLDAHVANFLDVIRNGGTTNCTVAMGKKVAIVSHMGNIAHRTGEKLLWDDTAKKFTNSEKANALLVPNYSEPWQLPKI